MRILRIVYYITFQSSFVIFIHLFSLFFFSIPLFLFVLHFTNLILVVFARSHSFLRDHFEFSGNILYKWHSWHFFLAIVAILSLSQLIPICIWSEGWTRHDFGIISGQLASIVPLETQILRGCCRVMAEVVSMSLEKMYEGQHGNVFLFMEILLEWKPRAFERRICNHNQFIFELSAWVSANGWMDGCMSCVLMLLSILISLQRRFVYRSRARSSSYFHHTRII